MPSTGPIVGSFQIARAYGAPGPLKVRPMPAPERQPARAAEPKPTSRLVAGAVPGKVSFAGSEPHQDTSALAMYRHPADKNAAATAVSAGRLIDVNG
jgi:hypothetical protein